jgi:hypothetical protein
MTITQTGRSFPHAKLCVLLLHCYLVNAFVALQSQHRINTNQRRPAGSSACLSSHADWPLKHLLQELDHRGVRYPPSASRKDLEQLLLTAETQGAIQKSSPEVDHVVEQGSADSETAFVRQSSQSTAKEPTRRQIPIRKLLAELDRRGIRYAPTATRQELESLLRQSRQEPSSDMSQQASRQTERLTQKIQNHLDTDEYEIREPVWYREEDSTDVPAFPLRQTTRHKSRPKGMYKLPSSSLQAQESSLQDDDLNDSQDSRDTPRSTSANRSPPRAPPRKRKIYNPYGTTSSGDLFVDGWDALDRFGDAVADVAEAVLWGSEDVGESPQTKKGQARHWKDRMEEQIDYLFGIHDDDGSTSLNGERPKGETRRYNKPPGYREQRLGNSTINKRVPIWEEEGSILSVLFGRSTTGAQKRLERFFENNDVGNNILTGFIGSVMKGGLMVASYLCRWASVKGAIPQPVVVMAVTSAALTARRRVNVVIMTLLLLRTVGELIHGYVRRDEDWEDHDTIAFDEDSAGYVLNSGLPIDAKGWQGGGGI